MKNLFVYLNSAQTFVNNRNKTRRDISINIQIDNSLELGWKKEDIVFVTNFPYEYNGFKSLVVGNDLCCARDERVGKINVILYLLESGIVKSDELWWLHDLDLIQSQPITEKELDLSSVALGLTDYGWHNRWNTGSVFFTSDSEKIFKWLRERIYKKQESQEKALLRLTEKNYQNINDYYKKLNITYNFQCGYRARRHWAEIMNIINWPIRAFHMNACDICNVCGENGLKVNMLPYRLLSLFRKHLPKFCPKRVIVTKPLPKEVFRS
jgi:hypothetical protein